MGLSPRWWVARSNAPAVFGQPHRHAVAVRGRVRARSFETVTRKIEWRTGIRRDLTGTGGRRVKIAAENGRFRG